jgi:hypothetical protein
MGGKTVRVTSSGVHYGATADLTGLSGSGSTTDGNYSCPNTPNVLSNSDSSSYSNAGKYTVCTQSSNISMIKIHGTTMGSNGICVFPVQYVDSSHVYFKPDLTTGLPLSNCATISSSSSSSGSSSGSGIELTFSGINFNAVFIVDDTNQGQMQTCLATANAGGCPLYSYGKFR